MSTLKVANVHFESTGTNRIDYLNDNIIRLTTADSFSVVSGNLLIGRTDSTVGSRAKLDVNGAVNASAVLVNGTELTSGLSTGKAIAMVIVFG